MKSELINLEGLSFLKVDLEEVVQKDHSFFLGKIKASHFLQIYTVRPAQYDLEKHSALARTFPDDIEYYNHLIYQDAKNLRNKDFQRDPSDERISKISRFLNEEEYAFFPNTIIANCELINDWEDFEIDESSDLEDFIKLSNRPDYVSFLKKVNEGYELYIPFIKNSILVIDGQHRLEGLKHSSTNVQQAFDLVIAFIIGFDRSVIAKQFYTINYEQKAVNKSLLYQLTGEFSTEIDELSFMHNVVKLLNELEESPFYGRVKMLGKTPGDFPKEKKIFLSISQAFLIDALIRYINPSAKGTTYPPIFLRYFKDTGSHIQIVRAISRFFNAVRTIKPDWDQPDTSLLSKGMGVGALIKVFNVLFPYIFLNDMNSDWQNINRLTIEHYRTYLNGLENVDFSSEGPYGKTGSAGSINKIKDDIIRSLSYLNNPVDFETFERHYKAEVLPIFNTALE